MTDKQIIIDGVNVAECVYRVEEKCILKDDECYFFPNCDHKQLKRKEQECEKLKFDLKTEQKDKKYIKNWCIEAGKELAKHSFAWDGKEKNLVVQAMELNEIFEAKEKECEELKEKVKKYGEINEQETKDYAELWKQLDQLKAENEDLKIYIESNEQQVKEVETLVMDNDRLINELDQLKQTLAEIKEIAEDFGFNGIYEDCFTGIQKILQKINEVEDDNTRNI